MGNGRGGPISRGTAAGPGVLGGLGGLAFTFVLGFSGMWSGASAAAYPWPGDAAAAEAVVRAALVCLVAGVFDLTGAVAAWRGDGRRAARLYRFAGGGSPWWPRCPSGPQPRRRTGGNMVFLGSSA